MVFTELFQKHQTHGCEFWIDINKFYPHGVYFEALQPSLYCTWTHMCYHEQKNLGLGLGLLKKIVPIMCSSYIQPNRFIFLAICSHYNYFTRQTLCKWLIKVDTTTIFPTASLNLRKIEGVMSYIVFKLSFMNMCINIIHVQVNKS